MNKMIKLIINADDFGMSVLFNEAILDLLENKIIKSTTVMVNRIKKTQESQLKKLIELRSKNYEKLSVGLHLELDADREIIPQIEEQYNKFTTIFNFKPSHLDVHKMTKNEKAIKSINSFAKQQNMPVRNHNIGVEKLRTTDKTYQAKEHTFDELVGFVNEMEEGKTYEVIIHPGKYDQYCKSSLNKERELDYENAKKLSVFLHHKDIKIISYLDL